MVKDVVIVGGGVVGYCSAYYLSQAGHKVTVLEQSTAQGSASYHNAGMVVPSHFIPLASPGVIMKAIKWLLKSDSPFYIKPRANLDLIKWCWQFYLKANDAHVRRSAPVLLQLNTQSRSLYEELIHDFNQAMTFQPDGLLTIFNSKKAEKEERETSEMANKLGLETRYVSNKELNELDGNIHYTSRGAVYYPLDAFFNPKTFMENLEHKLNGSGVVIHKGVEVSDFVHKKGRIVSVVSKDQVFGGDEFVLAAGITSSALGKKLGVNIPMQGGKGYSITVRNLENLPRICSILTEAKVAVTPMNDTLRLAGTMEIAGTDLSVNRHRAHGYMKAVQEYIPDIKYEYLKDEPIWAGLRPCSPDGLPYIGRLSNFSNLIAATGHAMMGMSLGPVTGKIVENLVDDTDLGMDIKQLDPLRFN